MSRKGRCADNAAMEGFFGRLKNEFFRGRDWSGVTVAEFERRLDRWLGWYRSGRLREFREGGEVVWDTIPPTRTLAVSPSSIAPQRMQGAPPC